MLKAALSAQEQDAGQQAPSGSTISRELLASPAFPCLRHATRDGTGTVQQTDGFEAPDRASVRLAGTAPTASLADNVADYELNPFKRRGGEEIISTSFMGLQQSLGRTMSASVSQNLIGSHVIGSMPGGLTLEEKRSIIQQTPMSPSISLLSEMGLDKVAAATSDAKALRRNALRGAIVIFVTAGYSGKRFIFERCKELGVRSVILDGPDSWSRSLVDEGLAAAFVDIDFSDADTLFERLLGACRKVRMRLGDLDAITTFCELAVPLAARLAEHLGLPGNTPDSVDTARNKHAARACMEAAGLPTPRNFLVESSEQLEEAAEKVGFPAVIKPISGAASIGVIRVDDIDVLRKSYARVIRDLSGARVVAGALVEGDGGDAAPPGNAASWMDLSIMMEEYLDGPEVDVDLVLSDFQPVYGAITDNWPTIEPYFNETGSNCPSTLPQEQQLELLDLGIKAVQCMGFQLGVFHVELKYTSRGARLIEVNARMGGGPVRDTNLLVWGVDLVEQHITSSCGIPAAPPVAQAPLMEMAELSINARVTGTLEHDRFMDKFAAMDGVLYARPIVPPGGRCVSVADGLPTWVAEIMVERSPVEDAIAWIREIEQEVLDAMPVRPAKA